ncbi:MAG: molybdopterin molybdotransferase MoeA [Gammaproteobacteria bacterium]|nr:molybdopterin molybdotransferase MoeA [Gammaproteobacteria bacterium]
MTNTDCFSATTPPTMSFDQAHAFISEQIQVISCVNKVAIRSALGLYIAEDVHSTINVPSHINSAMDGYAINAKDIPVNAEARLDVAGTSFAGKPLTLNIMPGQCARIMTGGVMPAGTDTVIMQEDVQRSGDTVIIQPGHQPGQNVRLAGEDLAIGEIALKKGQKVMPAELGILASLGLSEVKVYRRLRVAFFSTGDELRSIGDTLGDGDIYDSNRYSLYGMLTRLGFDVLDMGVVADCKEDIERAFSDAADNADIIITSGGVSVGDADFVKETLNTMGEVKFWKVAMKPGRPLAFGKVKNAFFFGLPGNPVAVMVTFYQFVQKALLTIAGAQTKPRLQLQLPCTSAFLRKTPGRTEFIRGQITTDDTGRMSVASTGKQGSGILHSMSAANCFIVLKHDDGIVNVGDMVHVEPFDGFI